MTGVIAKKMNMIEDEIVFRLTSKIGVSAAVARREALCIRSLFARNFDGLNELRSNSILDVINLFCEENEISVCDIKGPLREHWIAHARQDLMRVLHEDYGASKASIARALNRDQNTIYNGIKKSRERLALALEPAS